QLFDGGEERVEVEVGDDHRGSVRRGSAAAAALAFALLALVVSGCDASTVAKRLGIGAQAVVRHCTPGTLRPLSDDARSYAAFAPNGAVARRAPGGRVIARFGARNVNDYPTVFGVVGEVETATCAASWYRV